MWPRHPVPISGRAFLTAFAPARTSAAERGEASTSAAWRNAPNGVIVPAVAAADILRNSRRRRSDDFGYVMKTPAFKVRDDYSGRLEKDSEWVSIPVSEGCIEPG